MSHTIQCPYCRRSIEVALKVDRAESLERTTVTLGVEVVREPRVVEMISELSHKIGSLAGGVQRGQKLHAPAEPGGVLDTLRGRH